MQLTRISPNPQITIPKEVFEKLRLEVGIFLEGEARESGMLLVPKKLVSKEQTWFWSKEWQEKEWEADQAIKGGVIQTLSKGGGITSIFEKTLMIIQIPRPFDKDYQDPPQAIQEQASPKSLYISK